MATHLLREQSTSEEEEAAYEPVTEKKAEDERVLRKSSRVRVTRQQREEEARQKAILDEIERQRRKEKEKEKSGQTKTKRRQPKIVVFSQESTDEKLSEEVSKSQFFVSESPEKPKSKESVPATEGKKAEGTHLGTFHSVQELLAAAEEAKSQGQTLAGMTAEDVTEKHKKQGAGPSTRSQSKGQSKGIISGFMSQRRKGHHGKGKQAERTGGTVPPVETPGQEGDKPTGADKLPETKQLPNVSVGPEKKKSEPKKGVQKRNCNELKEPLDLDECGSQYFEYLDELVKKQDHRVALEFILFHSGLQGYDAEKFDKDTLDEKRFSNIVRSLEHVKPMYKTNIMRRRTAHQ